MRNQKGITLVALVITIIVLLILAGVSISLVLGQNGVLNQASNAVVQQKKFSFCKARSRNGGSSLLYRIYGSLGNKWNNR